MTDLLDLASAMTQDMEKSIIAEIMGPYAVVRRGRWPFRVWCRHRGHRDRWRGVLKECIRCGRQRQSAWSDLTITNVGGSGLTYN